MGACPSGSLVGLRRITLFCRMVDLTTETGILAARAARAPEDARWRVIARNVFPFVVVFGLWEIVARAGVFPPKLFPSLVTVAETFVKGFLEASPIGKLAISAWLFTKFGGFAALRAAGRIIWKRSSHRIVNSSPPKRATTPLGVGEFA